MSDPPPAVHLSTRAARRIALAAQGFARPRPADPGTRDVQRVVDTVGVVQIDSVNVVVRSQYLPFFSRLGPYDRRLVDRARDVAPRRVVEYWAHEASLVPLSTWPLLDFRMRRAREDAWGGMRRVARDHPDLVAAVLAEVARRGPLTSRQVEVALAHDLPRQRDDWGWNWSLVKNALEHLFWAGEVSSAGRTTQFERRYALPARVLPPALREQALDPDARPTEPRGPPPARRDLGPGPRGGVGAVPARLLPALAGAGQAGRRLARGRRRAAARHRRGLAPAGLPAPRGTPSPPGGRPGPALAVRLADLAARPHPGRSSASTTASRSTCPRRSACTATTCCPSCSGRTSSPGST